MKSYHKIIYRRARLKFWTFLARWLSKVSNFFVQKHANVAARLKKLSSTAFRGLSDNKNKMPFPKDVLTASTVIALKQLGNDNPSPKDLMQAVRSADKVRGDGQIPAPPPTVRSKDPLDFAALVREYQDLSSEDQQMHYLAVLRVVKEATEEDLVKTIEKTVADIEAALNPKFSGNEGSADTL